MKHEHTEGCTCTSYLIDGVEFVDLPIEKVKEAIIELVNNTDDEAALQDCWASLVDLTGEYEDLGHCEQCGDYISKFTININ